MGGEAAAVWRMRENALFDAQVTSALVEQVDTNVHYKCSSLHLTFTGNRKTSMKNFAFFNFDE